MPLIFCYISSQLHSGVCGGDGGGAPCTPSSDPPSHNSELQERNNVQHSIVITHLISYVSVYCNTIIMLSYLVFRTFGKYDDLYSCAKFTPTSKIFVSNHC